MRLTALSNFAGKEFPTVNDSKILPKGFQELLIDVERDDDVETDSEIYQVGLKRCLNDCNETRMVINAGRQAEKVKNMGI